MPHASFKIKPGVDQNETPALNEAGLSTTNLIRFIYDRNGNGLVQKLGGWTKYYSNPFSKVIRAIWPWQDINSSDHLAIGLQNASGGFESSINILTDGVLSDVTPQYLVANPALSLETVDGSPLVRVTDPSASGVNSFCTVYISTQISIGGLILFGLYECIEYTGNTYQITAVDILGNPQNAETSTIDAYVPEILVYSGTGIITINLPNHGYNVGDTFSVLIPLSVGGITFYGDYIIQTVVDENSFQFNSSLAPSYTEAKFINNGKANYTYNFGVATSQVGSGYGVGGYGMGGYGYGLDTPVIFNGDNIPALNWSFDNWGSYLTSIALDTEVATNAESASANGTTATITFDELFIPPVGQSVTLSGFSPPEWNQITYIDTSSSGSFTFATDLTGSPTTLGNFKINYAPYQPIYLFDPLGGQPISVTISNAPPYNDGLFVAMPQRQLVSWGCTFDGIPDPLLIRWSDVNNFNDWIGTVINQAGSYRIPKGSKIVGGVQAQQQGLIFTDLGVWSMQYIGPPYVYGFNEIATGCGLIARKAVAAIAGTVYWMGTSQFFSLSGSGVQPVPCPVWDVIFQDLDTDNLDKIRVAVNSLFGEISWFYPNLSSGGENNSYVKYNVYLNCWDYGTMSRTAWSDQSVLGKPIGADPVSGYLYQHETSNTADGVPMNSFFRTGYFAMSEADVKSFVDEVWPDMKWGFFEGSQNARVYITFYVTDFAGQAPEQYGPYLMTESTQWFNPRFRGRLVSIQLSSELNEEEDYDSFWRIGNIRYRLQQDGRY